MYNTILRWHLIDISNAHELKITHLIIIILLYTFIIISTRLRLEIVF